LLEPLGAIARSWTVSFGPGPLSAFFFGTRDRSPTDRPEHYVHANGALSLTRVWLAPDDQRPLRGMLERLGLRPRKARLCLPRCLTAAVAKLPAGTIVLLPASTQGYAGRSIVGATITVRDLDGVRNALQTSAIDPATAGVEERGGSLFIPPALANGLWLEFRPA
jgi:hypothetical protein